MGDHGMQGGEELGGGGQGELSPVLDRSCFGRDLRREMSGSYFLVSMGALNEIILRSSLPGGVLGS